MILPLNCTFATSADALTIPKLGSVLGYKICLLTFRETILKTRLYNFDPLKPHFYIVKLGFTGVDIIFLISAQNIDCGTR